MLSRVADNLYWMSRYLERAEYSARVIGEHLNLMLEYDLGTSGRRWANVLTGLGSQDRVKGDVFTAAQAYALQQIVSSIAAARENGRQIREQITSEVWEELNRLYHEIKKVGDSERFRIEPYELVQTVLQGSHLFHGITDSTMIHGEGWQFIQAGRFLERVLHIVRLIDTHFSEFYGTGAEPMTAAQHIEWIGLLRSCTAFEAYCKVYTAELKAERVAEFLMLNAHFPHSIRYGVNRMREALDGIHESAGSRKAERLAKLAGRLTASLSYTPLEEIMGGLHDFLVGIRRLCGQIHSGIDQVYIRYPIEVALDA